MVKNQDHKQQFGKWGEDQAARYLEEKGYQLVARNVRTEYGELDLVVIKEGKLVFVEVKTRSSGKYGRPEEAITEQKIQHLVESALSYIAENPQVPGDWQIDVIAIETGQPGQDPVITHFEDAIRDE